MATKLTAEQARKAGKWWIKITILRTNAGKRAARAVLYHGADEHQGPHSRADSSDDPAGGIVLREVESHAAQIAPEQVAEGYPRDIIDEEKTSSS